MQVFLSCLLCVTVPDLILILWYINCYFDFEDKGGMCFWKCFLNITIETGSVCATHKEYQKSSEILRFSYICARLSLNRSGIHWHHELKRLRFVPRLAGGFKLDSNDSRESNKLQVFSGVVLLLNCFDFG